jgi:methylase of polypeptide subunit release factors
MLHLAQVGQSDRLADFACGSGGFLVHRKVTDTTNVGQIIGIDISLEWTRLARANVKLHGAALTQVRDPIRDGNALQVVSSTVLADETFDRILMNPPFGERIDESLAKMALRQKVVSSRSETALTALALKKLAEGGRAAILVPSGLLFSSSRGEKELRKRIVDEHELQAVVTFPSDALQPYSSLQAHLLLIHKYQPIEDYQTWFFQVERDGYPAGRGRDLTEEPKEELSDLPFIEGIWSSSTTEFARILPEQEEPLIRVRRILSEKGGFLGVVIEALGEAIVTSVDLFPETIEKPSFVLVESINPIKQQRRYAEIILKTGFASETHESRRSLWERIYKWTPAPEEEETPEEAPPETLLIRGKHPREAIAISAEGRLVGFTVPRTVIRKSTDAQESNYDLRFKEYLTTEQEIQRLASPAVFLSEIRDKQRQLTQVIDNLMGRLELPPIAEQKLPSPLLEEVKVFGDLNPEQQIVLEKVLEKIEPAVPDDENSYQTATLFTPLDLENEGINEVSDNTRLTLDLLEHMGVIVPVAVVDPSTKKPVAFYRRVTEQDVCKPSDLEEQA